MARKIIVTNTDYPSKVPNGTVMIVKYKYPEGQVDATIDGGDGFEWYMRPSDFNEYTPDDTPTLWRDMTPEQKGALLLAHYEGKVIEYYSYSYINKWVSLSHPVWNNIIAYRIKPEPRVETVFVLTNGREFVVEDFFVLPLGSATHRITINLIDGKPDCDSIKMKEL